MSIHLRRQTNVTFDLAGHIDDLAVAFDGAPREWDEDDELEDDSDLDAIDDEADTIEDLVSDLWNLSF